MSAADTTSRAVAEQALARDYEPLRDEVLRPLAAKLAAQRLRLDPLDLDAVYNQAWHALYDRLAAGEQIHNRAAFLSTVAYRRAIEEIRRMRPDRHAGDVSPETLETTYDIAGQIDDTATLGRVLEGLKDRLDARERRAAALCLIHGYTRTEAADMLGEPPKRMEKVMDGVTRKLAEIVGEVKDDWCRSRRSLVTAYALGLLDEDGERHRMAQEHLDDCSACRRFVNVSRGLAGMLPPVELPLLAGAVGVGVAGASAAGARRSRRPSRAQAAAGAATAVALVVLALLILRPGGDASPPRAPAPAAASDPPPVSAQERAARAAAAARRAERRRAAQLRRRREAVARRRVPVAPPVAASAPAAPAAQAEAPPPAEPVTPPPEPTSPPQPTPPPKPAPAAEPAPARAPEIVTDAAQEFGPER